MTAKQHVAVVGGRGWFGQAVVRAVRLRGLPLTVVSRASGPGVVAADPEDSESLARALARADVVINAAGYRGEHAEAAVAANFRLADRLGCLAVDEGWRLLHVGSAAEYGASLDSASAPPPAPTRTGLTVPTEPSAGIERIREDRPCTPTSLYGTTKLAGSRAVLRAWAEGADAAVARVFDVAAADLPVGSSLAGLVAQLRRAAASSATASVVEVGDPTMVRDISRRSWAAAAIVALAAADRSTDFPVVNVCSGVGVRLGEMAEALARHLDLEIVVRDLGWPRAGHVVGDPTLLHSLVELSPPHALDDLARSMLGPAAPVPVLAGGPR